MGDLRVGAHLGGEARIVVLVLVGLALVFQPGLLVLAGLVWLLAAPVRRARAAGRLDAAGVEAWLSGTSAADRAVLAGRRRL